MTTLPVKRRKLAYVRRPSHFEVAGCACGNKETQWSEFDGHCWCEQCGIDFKPEHAGILDGPVPVNISAMLGIDFRMIDFDTLKILDPLKCGNS